MKLYFVIFKEGNKATEGEKFPKLFARIAPQGTPVTNVPARVHPSARLSRAHGTLIAGEAKYMDSLTLVAHEGFFASPNLR